MGANDMQVGGQHYKTGYQHWDLVIITGMGYLEGCSTKYVSRWRKKNGMEDLKKALHYLNKLQENVGRVAGPASLSSAHRRAEVRKFALENGLTALEESYIRLLATWTDVEHLEEARGLLFYLMDEVEPKPVPLEDSNKHAERDDSDRLRTDHGFVPGYIR